MYKVFYNPKTLEIKGFSDGALSMDFPFIETDKAPILISNYKITMVDGVATLSVIKESFTDEEWNKIVNE